MLAKVWIVLFVTAMTAQASIEKCPVFSETKTYKVKGQYEERNIVYEISSKVTKKNKMEVVCYQVITNYPGNTLNDEICANDEGNISKTASYDRTGRPMDKLTVSRCSEGDRVLKTIFDNQEEPKGFNRRTSFLFGRGNLPFALIYNLRTFTDEKQLIEDPKGSSIDAISIALEKKYLSEGPKQ